jgi:diguanylate cyclase (GGDEF)-like protein
MSSSKFTSAHLKILKTTPLFKALSKLELDAVMTFLEPRSIKDGEIIFNEGDEGDEMFIIVSNKVDAWVSQADGTQRRMFELGPGDFFGEMSIIANESRSATLKAMGDLELLAIHGTDFYRIVFEYPMIGVKILTVIRSVQNTWLEQTSRHLGDIMRWGETARRRAVTDELTGLYNRRFLEDTAHNYFGKGVGLRNISFMMMDLDKIHEINNAHGMKAGDLVFISTADVLRSTTRSGDICARLSGDEFAILLPDTEPEEARGIAEKIRRTMAAQKVTVPQSPNSEGQTQIKVCTSIGIASAPLHTDCWDGLQLAADSALRRSKEMGRNRVEIAIK